MTACRFCSTAAVPCWMFQYGTEATTTLGLGGRCAKPLHANHQAGDQGSGQHDGQPHGPGERVARGGG